MQDDQSGGPEQAAMTDEPSTEAEAEVMVARREERHEYLATIAGTEIATLPYQNADDRIVLLTTTVLPPFRGRGIAEELIAYALDDIREQGVRITVLCPVVRAFIAEHPEYSDLVDPDRPDF